MEGQPRGEQFPTRQEILARCIEGLTKDDIEYLADEEQVPDEVFVDGLYGSLLLNGLEDPEAFLRDKGILE